MNHSLYWRRAALGLAIATALSACAGAKPASTPASIASPADAAIEAQVASYQLVANHPGRLIVALVSTDNQWVSFGEMRMHFSYLGASPSAPPIDASAPATPPADQTARFLPIPGTPPDDGSGARLTAAIDGRGLYGIESIAFPTPGYWQVESSGTLADGRAVDASAAFEVLATPRLLEVGDEAPRTDNAVIGDPGVNAASIDSRAAIDGSIPDPELHTTSITDAIDAHRPALVVFATPVYCVSQFCGPVTDMVADLAKTYSDRADFIHVEIYRDFDPNEVNQAALDWLLTPDGDLREPWVFLIGSDGRIAGSWDTMASRDEIEPLLQDLPQS